MPRHEIYKAIVKAVKKGKLKEPFSAHDLMKACPNLRPSTCMTFLIHHRKANPSKTSALFIKTSPGRFKLIRPIKYGL